MAKRTCYYCDRFHDAPMITKIRRHCDATGRKVKASSKSCPKYFVPTEHSFYCENNHCSLYLMQCLGRRRNRKNLNQWDTCSKCRQWDKEIGPIIQEYWFEAKPVKNPRKIRRRIKKKRIIRRRSTDNPKLKRKIKRRKQKTKIRRRSNA
jgi:hypothetical protein